MGEEIDFPFSGITRSLFDASTIGDKRIFCRGYGNRKSLDCLKSIHRMRLNVRTKDMVTVIFDLSSWPLTYSCQAQVLIRSLHNIIPLSDQPGPFTAHSYTGKQTLKHKYYHPKSCFPFTNPFFEPLSLHHDCSLPGPVQILL